ETAYCASKFALAGFSEALRTEIMSDGIDVSTIFPGGVETEIWQSFENQAGFAVPNYLPMLPARDLAQIIVQDARFPQAEIVTALDAQIINFFNGLAPGMIDLVLGQSLPFLEGFRASTAPTQRTRGNLYQPNDGGGN
ncbi:MAG: SDR family NAD(P)-dependent oxidoreductase, partial [Dehalococcoidia bacterium]